jgi:hypothetical protein
MKPTDKVGVKSNTAKTPITGMMTASCAAKTYIKTSIKKPKGFCLKSQIPCLIQV